MGHFSKLLFHQVASNGHTDHREPAGKIGYYNFWYPSSDSDEQGVLSESVSGMYLSWRGGGDLWTPYQVTETVAKQYGSPIRVIWVYNEDMKHG